MANIASVLKSEIARLARREIKAEVTPLKKAASQYRSSIAALKRQVQALERQLRRKSRSTPAVDGDEGGEEEGVRRRFRAGGLASHRRKLGLSAEDYGALVGVSGQSIYKWEQVLEIPVSAATARVLQCVQPFAGLVYSVVLINCATRSSSIVRDLPGRTSSYSPAKRRSMNQACHLPTVALVLQAVGNRAIELAVGAAQDDARPIAQRRRQRAAADKLLQLRTLFVRQHQFGFRPAPHCGISSKDTASRARLMPAIFRTG